MEPSYFIVVIYTPKENADEIRSAAACAGAGIIGSYDYCSFSQEGTGRYRPLEGSHPHIGTQGNIESVSEQRIEVRVSKDALGDVVQAIKNNHPYEEPAIHILPALDYTSLL